MTLNYLPLTPPASFSCLTARSTPICSWVPTKAEVPVSGVGTQEQMGVDLAVKDVYKRQDHGRQDFFLLGLLHRSASSSSQKSPRRISQSHRPLP